MRRPTLTKKQVVSTILKQQSRLQALGVKRLGLFGSFARGEQRVDSDIDLLVEFLPGQKTFDNFMQLGFLLEDLFQRRVELITPESLSPHLRRQILDEVEYAAITS